MFIHFLRREMYIWGGAPGEIYEDNSPGMKMATGKNVCNCEGYPPPNILYIFWGEWGIYTHKSVQSSNHALVCIQ